MTQTQRVSKIDITQLGLALTAFFVATFIMCIALGLVVPDWEMHKPWLQFFPWFEWLTVKGVLIGLIEAVIYAWYVAIVFGLLFNFFGSQRTARDF